MREREREGEKVPDVMFINKNNKRYFENLLIG